MSLQYSLRTLLLVTTILAVCLALIPRLTIVCLSVAAVAGTTLAVVELTVYFHRAVGFVVAVTFFVIGCILSGIAGAILFDQIAGYNFWSKLLAFVVFGGFAAMGFFGAQVAYREARAEHTEPHPDPVLRVEPPEDTRKQE
ncbi:MAG TPA: hypothetical protein VGK58_14090 [Lacipirellulaceae bacterium]